MRIPETPPRWLNDGLWIALVTVLLWGLFRLPLLPMLGVAVAVYVAGRLAGLFPD